MPTELVVRCPCCAWEFHEIVVESCIPPGLMASFSDPETLQKIMEAQRIDRAMTAIDSHLAKEHPEVTDSIRSMMAELRRH